MTRREAAQAALDALDGVADTVPFITVCKNLRAVLAELEPGGNMSQLRDAARAALSILENEWTTDGGEFCRYCGCAINERHQCELVLTCDALSSALAEPEPVRRWPFVESPGEFTARLRSALDEFGDLLPAVRCVLIEDPPTFTYPAPAQTPRRVTAEEDAILHKALLRGTKRLDAPAQAPMSDDQIMATASHFFDSPRWPSTAIDLARAVERHHGISS